MLKDFETLYKICMAMADTCLTDQTLPARMNKLHEEFQEVVDAFATLNEMNAMDFSNHSDFQNAPKEAYDHFIKELADLQFVLFHIMHKLAITPQDMLHLAGAKMFGRLNDPNYIAKEQRNG